MTKSSSERKTITKHILPFRDLRPTHILPLRNSLFDRAEQWLAPVEEVFDALADDDEDIIALG